MREFLFLLSRSQPVPSSVVHAECVPVLCEVGENYRIDLNDFAGKLEQDISAVIISPHAWPYL
jgi:hypothetical protein